MKRKLLILSLLIPYLFYGQVLLGNDIDGELSNDRSGHSVSLSNNGQTVAIGAYLNDGNGSNSGHVRVYRYNNSSWSLLGNDIDGPVAGDQSGWSVSLAGDGNSVAVGAPENDGVFNGGEVRVYKYNTTSSLWDQVGNDIIGQSAGNKSGWSVSLSTDGGIVGIGSYLNSTNGFNSGHVRIFKFNSANNLWEQLGNDINGSFNIDYFGRSLSLSNDGKTIAVGANGNDGNGSNSGHVRIFKFDESNWNQVGNAIEGEVMDDNSGWSVSLSDSGNEVAIGSYLNDENGLSSGQARVFKINTSTNLWEKLGNNINGEANSDQAGWSVSLSGDASIVAVGSTLNDDNGTDSGHVRIFKYTASGNLWNQVGETIEGEAVDDNSGGSVSLSGDGSIVAIGASGNDGNGSNSGHVRVYDLSAEVLSTKDTFLEESLSVYPNPATSQFHIKITNQLELKSISLINNIGQQVLVTSKNNIDVTNLNSGVYFVKIETDKGNTVKKLVIK
ncbi:Por secretion system C-terminal sorting domain-containing protein [Lutibacter oricola]|uniref:Por secretion system C-terminal sorting domain-containing protein n=1 Tax=Lutibacter oricola TaxID=762486 RepID=A0A1H2QQ34_9FLAO|nr:T9SS type A sorting domain-containing protein [Lutibacter oricola]SDW09262.1 Por secretion system C-terminal sorting domain-containing protein [Lutibacter oricola]